MLLIHDLPDKLSKANFFELDLKFGYWQVHIDEACVTRYDSYEFIIILFGMTSDPIIFWNLINNSCYEYLDNFIVSYSDDIVIYTRTLEDHLLHFVKSAAMTLRIST